MDLPCRFFSARRMWLIIGTGAAQKEGIMDTAISDLDLQVRYHIYRFFADHCRAPSYQEIAGLLNVEESRVRDAYQKLHARHLVFLERGADVIRIANPFSAIPTRFRVTSGRRVWWANCAWDSLGIAAALNLDVQIEARYVDSPDAVELRVENGRVDGKGHLVYFPLPFRQWYDDLVFT